MKQRLTTAILAIFLISAGAAFAGDVTFGAGSASFATDSGAGELVVTGPEGFRYSQFFKAGEAASFSLYDADGAFRADGTYNWQITVQGAALGERDAYAAKAEPRWGTFTIKGGAFVDPNELESLPTKDSVILDDLIVDGSACIGQDCVNGESFGFDTIRMKENNLRLRAVDTSSTSSFPSRDWQITFNDSSNGGANKFSIDDIDGGRTPFTIEAGAPSHSLYVDDGGRIGFGTSTPVAQLHVKDGNTPTLRLEQDGSSGFTAQTWDVAGNEANFFIRDATNGSTLPFRIFPGAPSNALTIEGTTGDIGIGTTSPDSQLHVISDTGVALRLERNNTVRIALEDNDAGAIWQIGNEADGAEFRVSKDSTGSVEFSVNSSGNVIIAGTCIEFAGPIACTATVGAFTCVSGNCP